MKKVIFILLMGAAFLIITPTYAANVFFDNMENGTNSWTADGFWHLETNPEDVQVDSDLNPDLVSLPDNGYLPEAYSGSSAWWYGEADTGTFIGDYTASYQYSKNGGYSDSSNEGSLTSPAIDLSDYSKASLSFWTWWEIEGVDVDRYDMMYVKASTDGVNFTTLDSINPINDVDGESYKPYSSGGLGQTGQWAKHTFSLNDYAGYSTVYIQFYFDTIDNRYNAFRGWLIDNVKVTNSGTVNQKPNFDATVSGMQSCYGGGIGSSSLKGGEFTLLSGQTVTINLTTAAGYWIEEYGTGNIVATDHSHGYNAYLPAGHYLIYPDLDGYCMQAPVAPTAYATVTYSKAAPQPNVIQSTGSTIIYGSNFTSATEVYFMGPKSSAASTSIQALDENQATEVAVISENKIEVTAPSLSDGNYNIKVVNGTKSKALKNALTITSDDAPTISSVSPSSIDNDTANSLAITGVNFSDAVTVTLGDFPCANATVTSGTTISCSVPAAIASGYQNLVVENSDGQVATLVAGVYVTNALTDDTFYESGGDTLYLNKKVKKLRKVKKTKTKIQIRWQKIKAAKNGYQIEIRKNKNKKLVRHATTKASYKKHTKWLKHLKSGVKYKIRVRGINKNGYSGKWSKFIKIRTK